MTRLKWEPLSEDRKDWVYSNEGKDGERGCIGHLRGDFGRSGTEFWTSWFDHQPHLKSDAFKRELQDVVNELRKTGGLLASFTDMRKSCAEGTPLQECFAFHAESSHFDYYLRCIPRRGDYNFYLYACDLTAQREQNRLSVQGLLKAMPHSVEPLAPKTKELER